MYRTNKVLKSTDWGNPGTAESASGTNHPEHIIVRTARRASFAYAIRVTVWSNSDLGALSGWVNRLHSHFTLSPI